MSVIKRTARVRALVAAAALLSDGVTGRSKTKVAALLKVDLILLSRLRDHLIPARNEVTRLGGDPIYIDKALAEIEHTNELKASSLKKIEPTPKDAKPPRAKRSRKSASGRLTRGISQF